MNYAEILSRRLKKAGIDCAKGQAVDKKEQLQAVLREIMQEGQDTGTFFPWTEAVRRLNIDCLLYTSREAVENLTMENLTESILTRKETAQKHFLRRLNYAYDFQKQDIEAYYREKKKTLQETAEREVPEETEPGDENG